MFTVRYMPVLFLAVTLAVAPAIAMEGVDGEATQLAEGWAHIKYHPEVGSDRLAQAEQLEHTAAVLSQKDPGSAELLYWHANILCLVAEIMHATGSLKLISEARTDLEKAQAIDPHFSRAMALLGSIYAGAPGWPLSFGSSKKAAQYLNAALNLNPAGIDENFFMGDYLLDKGKAANAVPYFEKAIKAADAQPNSPVAQGRKSEADQELKQAKRRLGE